MYPSNSDNRREHPDIIDENVGNMPHTEPQNYGEVYSKPVYNTQVFGEQPYNEPVYSEQVYNEPVYFEHHYNMPPHSQPIQPEPVYYNETLFSEPVYSEQEYNTRSYSEPIFADPNEMPVNMYSPGICVNQPYPRTRENGNGKMEHHAKMETVKDLSVFCVRWQLFLYVPHLVLLPLILSLTAE